MGAIQLVNRVAAARHTGYAIKAAKLLNAVSTIRGAITTVLLAASAVGGVATVQSVRSEVPAAHPSAAQVTRAPLDAAALRRDYEQRLLTALQTNAAAVDDLRKVAILPAAQLDALIADTKQKLQARYDEARNQLAAVAPTPAPGASAAPTASFSIVTLDALVRVAAVDMNTIVVAATRVATTAATPLPIRTPPPTIAPTPLPRTPTPTPVHTPTPTPRRT